MPDDTTILSTIDARYPTVASNIVSVKRSVEQSNSVCVIYTLSSMLNAISFKPSEYFIPQLNGGVWYNQRNASG